MLKSYRNLRWKIYREESY